MEVPKRIVLILGNGFDIDLGLKTKYSDFYESDFCPKDYPAPLIRHLNECWGEDIHNVRWNDLENELFTYALKEKKSDIIDAKEQEYIAQNSDYNLCLKIRYYGEDEIFSSLKEKGIIKVTGPLMSATIPYREDLCKSMVFRDREAYRRIKNGLCLYLNLANKETIKQYSVASDLLLSLKKTVDAGASLQIFSFNYTYLRSRYFDSDKAPIVYLHGRCQDKTIIVGTRDDIKMGTDYDFLQKSMDVTYAATGISAAMNEADEVIIFGHSLGENDSQYFSRFFSSLADSNRRQKTSLTIFTHNNDSLVATKRAIQRITSGRLIAIYDNICPKFIRTNDFKDDQRLFYDFLINHHIEVDKAETIISRLLPKS